MAKIFIKPKEGCIVRDPISKVPLKAIGQKVTETTFWRRRIKAGDVILADKVTPPAAKTEATPKEKPKKKSFSSSIK